MPWFQICGATIIMYIHRSPKQPLKNNKAHKIEKKTRYKNYIISQHLLVTYYKTLVSAA